jgi:ribosomal protein S18 acetylase RimI-like enzyme
LQSAADRQRPDIRIVPFARELSAHFYRLNEWWLSRYFRLETIDERVLSDPEGEIVRPGGAVFFALIGAEVVGTCALKVEEPGSFELTKMGVDERHQGIGIGRRLLEAAIAEFRRRDGHTLYLETNAILTPALRLYESMGFERQPGRKPGSVYERSDVYMIWRANAAD